MSSRLQLGAPGVYLLQDEPLRALTGVRMDVCAFAGVAPRGPARAPFFGLEGEVGPCDAQKTSQRTVPVPVESWSEYQRLFGSFEGPGLLPYAVASFFENGGRRAYVLRIVHDYAPDPLPSAGVARAALLGISLVGGGAVALRARNEGNWGNRLSATLSFRARTLLFDAPVATAQDLTLPRQTDLAVGALLRITISGGVKTTRFVSMLRDEWHVAEGVVVRRAIFDQPLPAAPAAAEVIEGSLSVDDGDGRSEVLERIGFAPEHPRWLATVLTNESSLLYPDDRPASSWLDGTLSISPALGVFSSEEFRGGEDRYRDLAPADFFGAWLPGDECPGEGVQAIAETSDVALLCVPDLYSPAPLVSVESIIGPSSLAGPEFAPCVELPPPPAQAAPAGDLDGLRLDPQTDLDAIVALQQALVDFADAKRSFVVLLDVPPGLSQQRILYWRSRVNSAFAAAYHPWLDVTRDDDRRDALIRINPSAVAAGIIAQREVEKGVPYGPANVVAAGVVRLADLVSPARHDELHPLGVNVYLNERDGARLSAARTLSLDPDYRQLSVRRLVSMLERVLDRQMQWMVFEPNTPKLRRSVAHLLTGYLRQLFRANAFQGNTEQQAFFVRCDEQNNSRLTVDSGQLIAEVGIAPAEPLEFIVLSIQRDGDGTLRVGAA